ncbi:glycosyltransferase family A protein [Lysinimonas soli]|uniref:Glycosyltransferase family A protein n=1 Tax=Lysinimonas soli TaxID=1074233 RepID=A0ABW0NTJ2_9MICO
MPEQPTATVAILTFNGETYLRRILEAVSAQRLAGGIEILVIDSGSTDSTLDIVADFPAVVLHRIPNSEFGHGKTRNLAAELATGRFVAYLTHDAIPMSPLWLEELLAPFELDEKVVAVMGKQVPRPNCFPLMKYDIIGAFAQFGPDFGTTLFYRGEFAQDEATLGALAFYSDVNSAARRAFLVNTIPYRDVRYAEDQLFGRDVIDAGYHKAYAPRAAVEHSNDLNYDEFGARIFDETVGLRQIGTAIPPMRRRAVLRRVVRGSLADSLRIARDPAFGLRRRLYWLVVNPFFHVRKWTSYRRATTVDVNDAAAVAAGSLEMRRKKV